MLSWSKSFKLNYSKWISSIEPFKNIRLSNLFNIPFKNLYILVLSRFLTNFSKYSDSNSTNDILQEQWFSNYSKTIKKFYYSESM